MRAYDVSDAVHFGSLTDHVSSLIFAAMDTTSNTLSRMLQTLAEHTDVQEKLRQELLDTGAAHGMSYEQLNQLPYLDAVCRESLRL